MDLIPLQPFSSDVSEARVSKQAEDELGETSDTMQYGLVKLKEYIQNKEICGNTEDEFLMKFLRVKKYRFQDSIKMLVDFTENIGRAYDKLGFIEAESVKHALSKCSAGILPYRDPEGRATIYFRLGKTLDQGLMPQETISAMVCSLLHVMDQPSSQVFGMNILMDSQYACLKEVPPTIDLARMFAQILKGTPVRVNRIDVIYAGAIFRICYYAVIPFAPMKLVKKVTMFNDPEPIYKYYNKSALPNEFGGEAGPLSNEHWMGAVDAAVAKIQKIQARVLRASSSV